MIIVDVEIEKAILGQNEEPIPGIVYCQGWRDFESMGISVVCTYDTDTHLSRAFLKEDLQAFAEYITLKPTAGFNTRRFDIPLINTVVSHQVGVNSAVLFEGSQTHYDILEEIWIALGLNPDEFDPRTHGGWGLDAVCGATLGIHKTGNGTLAPVWWQQGKQGKVIDYCLNDCHLEGQLLLHIIKYDGLVTNGKDQVRIALPHQIPALQADLPEPEARYSCFVTGCPGNHPSKWMVCTTTGGLGIVR